MSDPEKARHYLEVLDAARCNGRWQEVPELARKIGKHAPKRQCLCLTAQTENRVATFSAQRPHTASSLASTNLPQTVVSIQAAIEKEEESEDRFQARVCLAWVHSVLNEPSQVLSILSAQEISHAIESFNSTESPAAKWTHVCIVKGAYLRGTALENSGNAKEAVHFYESIFPYLSKVPSGVGNTLESILWTERFLARHISLVSRHVKSSMKNPHVILKSKTFRPAQLLGSFRLWFDYRSERQNGNSFSLAWVWKAYYDVLSILLQNQIAKSIFSSKAEQYLELQRIQTAYEAILMTEARFPQADQSSTEIDNWVDQVMANWRALLTPFWQAEDFGQGGYHAVGKNVLEILYRSATKSFHSSRILRHLFTVHAQLGEFNLAGKALDTYLEIVAKGKARFEKSGETEPGFDDDTTTLCTAAEGIKMLCNHGDRADVERALEVAEILQAWINKVKPAAHDRAETSTNVEVSAEDNPDDLIDQQIKPKSTVQGRAMSLAYCAIGVSHCRWSRLTYEENSRSDLLTTAVSNFRAALRPEYENQDDIDVLYSLAYAFCEQQDIESAITTAKEAISLGSVDGALQNGHSGLFTNHRTRGTLLRCWHLLALLLSARQDFEKAMASCEAAEELFGGKTVLYGDASAPSALLGLGIAEKKGLIELKLTQLALLEVLDGPEEAVNSSGELFGLYAKLFKYSEKGISTVLEAARAVNKTDTVSPHRSIRGSILGYPKDRKSKLVAGINANNSVGSLEPSNEFTGAPAIAITSDDTILPQDLSHNNHFLGRHASNKLKKRHSRKSLQGGSQHRSRTTSPLRPATSEGGHSNLSKRGRQSAEGPSDSLSPHANTQYSANEVGLAISHDLPSSPPTPALEHSNTVDNIASTSQNMDKKTHNYVSPQDFLPKPIPTPSIFPDNHAGLFHLPPHFPHGVIMERLHHSGLIRVWLTQSMNYRRNDQNLDAQAAIQEATNCARAIEDFIAKYEHGSNGRYTESAYGGLETPSMLWGDIHAEQGQLYLKLGELTSAVKSFNAALGWDPGHPEAIIGLSKIYLDVYEGNFSLATLSNNSNDDTTDSNNNPTTAPTGVNSGPPFGGKPTLAPLPTRPPSYNDHVPETRSLAAITTRDHAFKLLYGLTRSGRGWDNGRAWMLLGKAYELSGDLSMARTCLEYVATAEQHSAIRAWSVANVY